MQPDSSELCLSAQNEVSGPRAPASLTLELCELWETLTTGRAVVVDSYCEGGRCFLVLERRPFGQPLASPHAVSILRSVLGGESHKSRGLALGLAVSTIASHCSSVLRAVGCGRLPSRAPIALVMAALAAAGVRLPPAERVPCPELAAERFLVATPVPGCSSWPWLTEAEDAVARAAIEGKTYAEIAVERETSPRTVANQLASVFRKVGVYGKSELRAKVVRDHARQAALLEPGVEAGEPWGLAI